MNAKRAAAMIAIKADSKSLERDLSAAKKKLRTFGSDIKKVSGKAWGGGKGALSKLGAGLGIQAATGLTESIQGVRDFERNLVRLQIASGKSAPEMAKMREQILGVSRATGVASDEILDGVSQYVALTGDVNGATAAMSSFARIAQASGAKVSEVAQASAALRQAMKLDPADIESAFSAMIVQGKAGAVEIKDFAGELAELAPQFAQFKGGTGLGGIREMGAAFQIIRQGAGSASGAATQFQALMGELVAKHKELGKIGVKVFEKDGKSLRNFSAIMEDISKNKALDKASTVSDIFGRKESQAAIRTIRSQIGAMDDLRRAGEDTGAVQRDLGTFLESSAGRMDVAINNLKLAIVDAFTPERIAAFVSALEDVAAVFAKIVGFVETIFGHAIGESGFTNWQEKQFDKFAGGLTDREKEVFTANIGPGGALSGTGEGTVTEAALKGGVMSGQIPESLAEKIRAHQATLRQHPGRVAMTEEGSARRAVETAQTTQMLNREIAAEIANAIKGLQLTVKMDGSAVAKTVDNAPSKRSPR